MKKNKIKYIFELVFIFILPLLFILPNFSIKKDYVYDNQGNYQISNIYIDNNLEQIYNYETITPYTGNFHYNLWVNTNNRRLTFELQNSEPSTQFMVSNEYNNFTFQSSGSQNSYTCRIDRTNNIVYLEIENWDDFSNPYKLTISENFYIENNYTYFNIKRNSSQLFSNVETDFYEDETGNLYISQTSTSANRLLEYNNYYTLFGKLKNIINDNLHIDNIAINIIVYYTFVWFIMFVIWHLFYLLLDFLLHFWKKEDD